MLKIQKCTLLFLFLLLLGFRTNAQSKIKFTRADALKEINDTINANKAAILKNDRQAPFYLIPFSYAHRKQFRFNQSALNKLLDYYIITRKISDVEKRSDLELHYVFEVSNDHQLDILFWLRNTNIYKDRLDYDYYKMFNVKEQYERKTKRSKHR